MWCCDGKETSTSVGVGLKGNDNYALVYYVHKYMHANSILGTNGVTTIILLILIEIA